MKKKLVVLFSVSITAGTIYFSYLQLKQLMINSLLKLWTAELKKSEIEFKPTELSKLKDELQQLNVIEINLIKSYSLKKIHNSSKNEMRELYGKLIKGKILEKVDLTVVKSILFSTN
jgi:hypothetical protein